MTPILTGTLIGLTGIAACYLISYAVAKAAEADDWRDDAFDVAFGDLPAIPEAKFPTHTIEDSR